jgi:hypothetical protein
MASTIFPFCKYCLFRDINLNPGTFPTACVETDSADNKLQAKLDTTVMLRSPCGHLTAPRDDIMILLVLTSLTVSKMQLKGMNGMKTIS